MISSLAHERSVTPSGLQIPLRRFTGAHAARVIAAPNSNVPEHAHDWPMLSLYVIGDYRKTFDGGDVQISGPSAVLHGTRRHHANDIQAAGLEQIDVEFDPAWLKGTRGFGQFERVRCWAGGPVAASAGRLARMWCEPRWSQAQLRQATARFVQSALAAEPVRQPSWLSAVRQSLDVGAVATAEQLARPLELHPTWLAQAYRSASGEGIRETIRRLRVQHATGLLRDSTLPLAQIAVDAGFCDQSHMNRAFRRLLGRTPLEVRVEGALLRCGPDQPKRIS